MRLAIEECLRDRATEHVFDAKRDFTNDGRNASSSLVALFVVMTARGQPIGDWNTALRADDRTIRR
jgi:hypothetical protein